jgi:DNA-directed RNA polymerase specialized sigma24 family protein
MRDAPLFPQFDAIHPEPERGSGSQGRTSLLRLFRARTTSNNERVRRTLDDLVNECFLKLRHDLGQVALDDPQGSLYVTLRKVEQAYGRMQEHGEPETSNGGAYDYSQLDPALRRSLGALSLSERNLLELHVGRGLTCSQIAAQMDVAREAVLQQLISIYARLKSEIGGCDLLEIYRRE